MYTSTAPPTLNFGKQKFVGEQILISFRDSFQDKDDAFFIGDLGDIVKKYRKFKHCLPNVEPFYGKAAFRNISLVCYLS